MLQTGGVASGPSPGHQLLCSGPLPTIVRPAAQVLGLAWWFCCCCSACCARPSRPVCVCLCVGRRQRRAQAVALESKPVDTAPCSSPAATAGVSMQLCCCLPSRCHPLWAGLPHCSHICRPPSAAQSHLNTSMAPCSPAASTVCSRSARGAAPAGQQGRRNGQLCGGAVGPAAAVNKQQE